MNHVWRLGWVLALTGCSGQVDLGSSEPSTIAVVGAKLVQFAPVPRGMCALFDNHRAYCWGELGSTKAHRAPMLDAVVLAGAGSQGEICGIDEAGTVSCSLSRDEKRVNKLGVPPAVDVRVGFFGGCALDDAGQAHCWLGEGQTPCEGTSNEDWLNLQLPSRAVDLDFEENHGCAVTEDGKLYCFGMNFSGESGQPRSSSCLGLPTEVPGLDDVEHVALGMEYSCALRRGGVVTCFGETTSLGNGKVPRPAETEPPRMLDVPDLDGVVALKSSRIATCALESTGTLKCWGTSECGSLGISENCESTWVPYPIVVQSALNIRDFGMDDGLTCALTADDSVQCWGFSAWDGQARGNPVPRYIDFE